MNTETVLRANAYHVLARGFAKPAEWDADMPRAWQGFAAPGSTLQALADKAGEAAREALGDPQATAVAHARLFLGPLETLAPPYASAYLDPDQRLMGPVSVEAAEAYAEAGLGPGDGPREAPDHVSQELEFMYFLAFQQATTTDAIWSDRQRRFWRGHLGRWLPELAKVIVRSDAHPFYRALGELLDAFSDSEAGLLSTKPVSESAPTG